VIRWKNKGEVIDMARRRAIEADELFQTADQLQADGKEVTAVALLDALGGGSLRTIYKHLEAWQQRRPALVITAPEEIPAGVQSAFGNAWRLATQEAGRAVIAAKEKAAEEVDAALKQFQGALDAIGKLEAESEADAQQIDSLKERVAELEAALQKSQTDGAAYKATGEQLQHQVKSQEAELERLHGEIDKERTGRQQESQRITAAAETAKDKAAQQIESLKSELSEAQSRAQKVESEKAEALSRRDEAQQQREKAELASKADRTERDTAIKEAAEFKGKAETLQTQYSQLLGTLGEGSGKKKS
jgi:DNA repair exonuclease SbcCD ATPase subunit